MSVKAGTTLFAILGMAVTGLIGYQAGKSKGQEQREALQREVLRMQAVALQRSAAVAQLREYIAGVDAELNALGLQRGALVEFVDWLAAAHPDVLERYRGLPQAENDIAALEQQTAVEHWAARQQYVELRRQFPGEAAKLPANDREFLS